MSAVSEAPTAIVPVAAAAAPAGSAGAAVTFWVLAVVSVAAAFGMIIVRRAVHSALLLAVVMLSLAVLYAAQGAPFLAFVQVIVYTGAVLMLFLFVLMLVGVDSSDSLVETLRGQRLATVVVAIGFALPLIAAVGNAALSNAVGLAQANSAGNVLAVAQLIFTRYVFAFEATSALLITAALGAMVLAHRERTKPKPSQQELSKRRFTGGGPQPTPLPNPGVYARHNAVDMPALLPDGTPASLSVNPIIAREQEAEGKQSGQLPPEAPGGGSGGNGHAGTSLSDRASQ